MPNFGNTDFASANYHFGTKDRIAGGIFQMGLIDGQGESITVYGGCAGGPSDEPHDFKCALYDENFNLVPNSETEVQTWMPDEGWNVVKTCNFGATKPQLIANDWYYIVCWVQEAVGTAGINSYYDVSMDYYLNAMTKSYDNSPFPGIINFNLNFYHYMPTLYCTYSYAAPPDCVNPDGTEGDIICGNSQYGQNPTHRYECQCIDGVCNWGDLGYDASCDVPSDCINPPGNNGEIICGNSQYGQDPTHQYECIDGIWTDLGYNVDCDIGGCINPTGNENDIICGDPRYGQDPTHRYQCIDGSWVDQGYNAACAEPGPEIPWLLIGIGAAAGISILAIAAYLLKKKR